ncbi:hypothetical protein GALMADRAFT_146295 [Galerina marginata CBS 339.88]|uniref:Uncharacterized protein n=1 Tax=Galerina marginata (strain CBS 339.88) TaxID=685588 RepID=A0A067SBN2_GALM3|nr:hypothetical protein GALMADRAFT_146295 [Galerina marginata CBS 339.88]
MSALFKALASIPLSKAIGVGFIGAAGFFAAPALLPAVGFTASGVTAGSAAAAAQSTFYGPATSGIFSVLQSAGITATPYLGTAAALLTAGAVAFWRGRR